jgi:plasmid stabilization system protein ParE
MPEIRHIRWSLESSERVFAIKKYLIEMWGDKEANFFLERLRHFENLVTRYPKLFPKSDKFPSLRKAVITKHQSVIYEIDGDLIRVHTILDHRQEH